MKLNDPFGRVERRQQNSYESLRASLVDAGVTTRNGAEAVLSSLVKRAVIIFLVVVLITAAVVLFVPQIKAIVFVLAFITLLWVLVTTLNGYSLVKRYIKDELSK